jgi:RND family efflux transporter MFP subunit
MSEQRHSELGIHPLEGIDPDHNDLPKRQQMAKRTRLVGLIVLVLLLLGGARTLISRVSNEHALEAGTSERAVQYVQTVVPSGDAAGQKLSLPGTLQGYVEAPISARSSGYVKRWTADIGARVKKGEVLAEIETPEIDQQLSQATASREQATAGLGLADSTLQRWIGLRQKDVVSQQDLDERRSADTQARANLDAARANEQRLRQLEDFKLVVAPFDGVVTRRNVDVGDLIDAGGGTSRALFVLSQTDPLRIYVNVPQTYAQLVKTGQKVVVTQSELGGEAFTGTIARTSASIDAATRTMQVEVALPNHDGLLLPGAYVQVVMALGNSTTLTIPANTLLFRSEGTRVAVVDAQGKITLRPVILGRNLGDKVEITSGLQHGERIVLNPSDSLANGDVVSFAPSADAASAPPAKAVL